MYKMLFFLHKSDDEKILEHFRNNTIDIISRITESEVKLAEVESNLLTTQKYSHFCEAVFSSKEEMERLMNSKYGLELNKDIMEFHKFLTIISVNYNY